MLTLHIVKKPNCIGRFQGSGLKETEASHSTLLSVRRLKSIESASIIRLCGTCAVFAEQGKLNSFFASVVLKIIFADISGHRVSKDYLTHQRLKKKRHKIYAYSFQTMQN